MSPRGQFYREQKARREARNARIREYDARVAREAEERRKAEEARRVEEARKAAEAARLLEVQEARKRAQEQTLKRRSEQDIIDIISAKRLRHGVQVTAVGRSLDLGDAFVLETGPTGVMIEHADGSRLTTSDPEQLRKIVPYVHHEELNAIAELKLVYMACDEYEAAVSLYHCVCTQDGCMCARTAFASTATGAQSVSRARPIAFIYPDDPSQKRRPFDQYICAEKIDRRRLHVPYPCSPHLARPSSVGRQVVPSRFLFPPPRSSFIPCLHTPWFPVHGKGCSSPVHRRCVALLVFLAAVGVFLAAAWRVLFSFLLAYCHIILHSHIHV